MAISGRIVEEVSRVIAGHLGKPENIAALKLCREKELSYENWLQVEILNALTDAGLHPTNFEMWTDAPCWLTQISEDEENEAKRWCDWVLRAPKEKQYVWVELKTIVRQATVSERLKNIEAEMALLDRFWLGKTNRRWGRYSGKWEQQLRERAESLLHSTHLGVYILSGVTDLLETEELPHRPMWSSPARYEISEPFALWVWDRLLERVL